MNDFLEAAIEEAKESLSEVGIPIASVLVINGRIVSRGHNQRVQKGSAILHAEMDCLEKAGRLKTSEYGRATLYTALSPCDMCTGTVLLYGIPNVVIGENSTFREVKIVIHDNRECRLLMEKFINENPTLWNEDIGEYIIAMC